MTNKKLNTFAEIFIAFDLNIDDKTLRKAVYNIILLNTFNKYAKLLTVSQMKFIIENSHLCDEGFICIKTADKNIIIDSQAELNAFIVGHVISEIE